MYLYTLHGSSGSKYTSDTSEYYFVDVEHPTKENPVKEAINVVFNGSDAEPDDILVGSIIHMTWCDKGKEKTALCWMIRLNRQNLIQFLLDIQSNSITNIRHYQVALVDINSPAHYKRYFPIREEDKMPIRYRA